MQPDERFKQVLQLIAENNLGGAKALCRDVLRSEAQESTCLRCLVRFS
jgi:hypothetical protein